MASQNKLYRIFQNNTLHRKIYEILLPVPETRLYQLLNHLVTLLYMQHREKPKKKV